MKKRTEVWLGLVVLVIGGALAAIVGLFAYMSVTATPIHPTSQNVPTKGGGAAAPRWSDAVQRGRQLVTAAMVDQNLPGVSVAVGSGTDIVWAEGFGWANLETRTPVAPDTVFDLGTASTMLTSVGAGLLVDRDRLKLDDEIQTYVPDFPRKPWPVTVRQLMTHTGGTRNDAGDEEPHETHCDDTTGALPRFASNDLLFEPGTKFHYSSYGWILVSAAMESAANERFPTFMRREVFDRLGMHATTFASTDPVPGRTTFYFPRFAGDPRYGPQEPGPLDLSCFTGAAGFLSTPSDLVRLGMAINGGTLLRPETSKLLETSTRLPSGDETGSGLGWKIDTVTLAGAPARAVGQNGSVMGGRVVTVLTFPERGLVVAVAANTAFAKTFELASSLADAFASAK